MFNKNNKQLVYVYDFLHMTILQLEFLEKVNVESKAKYPAVSESIGTIMQPSAIGQGSGDLSEEDILLMHDLKMQNEDLLSEDDMTSDYSDIDEWDDQAY